MAALAFVSRVRALKRWLHIQSMCQCFSKQNDKWHKRGGCYVVPRCRFLLICNWVPTTINQFSDTILEKLTQMQARNDSASLSLNQGDVQQTPSAEIQLCRNIWLWYRWKIWLWFLPSSWPSSLAHTHTHTHTHRVCTLLLIQPLSLPSALLEEFDLTWESMNSSTQQNAALPQSTGSRQESVLYADASLDMILGELCLWWLLFMWQRYSGKWFASIHLFTNALQQMCSLSQLHSSRIRIFVPDTIFTDKLRFKGRVSNFSKTF